MKVLIACEESQAITIEMRKLGIEAYSCDILPCSWWHPEWHIQWDAIDEAYSGKYDMMIAHPPCTYLSVSGIHWNDRGRGWDKTNDALDFVKRLMQAPIERIAIENPVSIISSRIRKPDQIINPYQFGDDASKKTCLWLKNLPLLTHTQYIQPRIVDWKKRWWNQWDDWQNYAKDEAGKLTWWNTVEIKQARSKTFPWIAKAIAEQWWSLHTSNNQ